MSKLVKAPGLGYIRGITNGEEVKLNKKHNDSKSNGCMAPLKPLNGESSKLTGIPLFNGLKILDKIIY